jgi:transposase-like protein
MQRRKWDAQTKALIGLEGLKGKPVAELSTEPQISQSQYYPWRDQFLANAAQAFEVPPHPGKEGRLEQENARVKQLVGEPTIEFKKSDAPLGGRAAGRCESSIGMRACSRASKH